jgi:hypothetical protein
MWSVPLLIYSVLRHLTRNIAALSWRSYEPCLVESLSQHIKRAFYAHTTVVTPGRDFDGTRPPTLLL